VKKRNIFIFWVFKRQKKNVCFFVYIIVHVLLFVSIHIRRTIKKEEKEEVEIGQDTRGTIRRNKGKPYILIENSNDIITHAQSKRINK